MSLLLRRLLQALLLAGCWNGERVWGQEQQLADPALVELRAALDRQAGEIDDLRARLERREAVYEATLSGEHGCDVVSTLRRLPVVVEEPADGTGATCVDECLIDLPGDPFQLDYFSDYDGGFLPVRPVASQKHPFELKVNGWIQFRHHAFSRNVEAWTDNAGVTRPVLNRNAFDIERGRLLLSGFVQDPRLTYFLQLDGDTDDGHFVDFFDYWWAWEFHDQFRVQVGKRKVSASRQWLLTARVTRFVARPMANDFFRPDRTVGVWGVGKVGETGHYEVMAGNGYDTPALPNSQTDARFAFAATNYFDSWGDYGEQLVDFEAVSTPLVRWGHSVVFAPQAANPAGRPQAEADFLRLTDGTRLTQLGALAPGVTVSDFDVFLYGIDGAFKWRGWSANAEVFLRWIEGIRGDGPVPMQSLFQRGFYVEGGRFLVPERLDANLRMSQVSGLFGNSYEYAAGLNWYPLAKTSTKVSFDVTALIGNPVQNTGTDILVGDDGVLFRTQLQAEF